jgi:hypothetical protein
MSGPSPEAVVAVAHTGAPAMVEGLPGAVGRCFAVWMRAQLATRTVITINATPTPRPVLKPLVAAALAPIGSICDSSLTITPAGIGLSAW